MRREPVAHRRRGFANTLGRGFANSAVANTLVFDAILLTEQEPCCLRRLEPALFNSAASVF